MNENIDQIINEAIGKIVSHPEYEGSYNVEHYIIKPPFLKTGEKVIDIHINLTKKA